MSQVEEIAKIPDYSALWMKSDLASPAFFGSHGLFHFTKEVHIRAFRSAVQMMYQAGYDPRGLVRLFEHYTQMDKRSPYPTELLEQGIEAIRQEISKYVPLKNPIVRTPGFYKMKQKVMSL